VMVFDIDNFSDLNASRGMEAGDDALSQIARQLSQELDHGASMARLGGAQFAVLMPRVFADAEAAAGQAGYFAQRIRQVLQSSSQEMEGDLFHLRATVGVAIYPENPFEVAGEIVRRAETARRKGKASGGDTVMFFEASMGEMIESRLKGEHALRAAIANQELAVFLQSQVDSKGRILGAEALVRWNHPERGLLAPGTFIPQAETSNLIVELDRWMLDQVCALIAFLGSQHVAVPISVNISPRHFREPDFVEHILATLERHSVPPRQLVLEVTEGMMLEDLAQVIERMAALNRHGVYFSLDDFGTGYSSLAYLKQLPLWELKIDQSFTQGVDVNPNDASLVEVILDIALRFNLHVVAEGVETDAQAQFLRQRGVPSMQGYLFSRPKNLVSWLAHFGLTRP
jgi:diguanylate cyclase (GGDEF)-like protein